MCSNPNTRFLIRLITDILLLSSVYCVALAILPLWLKTQQRGFFCGDETLAYPFKQDTILKRLHITILVIAVPAASVLCIEMLRVAFSAHSSLTPNKPQRYAFVGLKIPTFVTECYSTMGIYLFGLALVLTVTTLTKTTAGRLAPYFFEVCQPVLASNETACASQEHFGVYIENYTCGSLTSSTHLLTIMRQSFPSTQVAAAGYAMAFLVIYFQARLKENWLIIWRTFVQSCALIISLLVAAERLMAYRHHWSDVAGSLIIGYLLALFITHAVLQFFQKVPLKRRHRISGQISDINGRYTIMTRLKY